MVRDVVSDAKAGEYAKEAAEVGSPRLVLGGNANNAARSLAKPKEITIGRLLVSSTGSLVIFYPSNKGGDNDGQ
jgi:hypothetical protein